MFKLTNCNGRYCESGHIYKLHNNVVKHMILELFDYQAVIDIPITKLHSSAYSNYGKI